MELVAYFVTQFVVGDTQAGFGGKAQHADLALVQILVHLVGGFAGLQSG